MGSKDVSVKCLEIAEFVAIYAASSTISTAMDNISIGLLILFTVYEYYKNRREKTIFPDKAFNICYWPFFILIILAALLVGYQDSMTETLKLVKFSIIAFGSFYFALQRQFHEHAIINGISLGLLTICAYSLQQFIVEPLGVRIPANFAQPNNGCMMIILSVPFVVMYAAWKKDGKIFRWLTVLAAIASCWATALTGSRGGIIGLCLGGLIWIIVQTVYVRKLSLRKLLSSYVAVLAVVLCIGATYYFTFYHHQVQNTQQQTISQTVPESKQQPAEKQIMKNEMLSPEGTQVGVKRTYDNERILMWKSSWEMWKDHKLYGVGLWHWNTEYQAHYVLPQAKEPGIGFPHNIFVSFFSMTGVLGGIGYVLFSVGMFFYLCYKLKRNPDDIFLNALIWSLLAVTLHGAVDVGILYRHAMILYSAYLGIGLASVVYHDQRQEHSIGIIKGDS